MSNCLNGKGKQGVQNVSNAAGHSEQTSYNNKWSGWGSQDLQFEPQAVSTQNKDIEKQSGFPRSQTLSNPGSGGSGEAASRCSEVGLC